MRTRRWVMGGAVVLALAVVAACYVLGGGSWPPTLVVPHALHDREPQADTALRELLFDLPHSMLVMQRTAAGYEPVQHYRYAHSSSDQIELRTDRQDPLHISDYLLFDAPAGELFLVVRAAGNEPWRRLELTGELLAQARSVGRLRLPMLTSLPTLR